MNETAIERDRPLLRRAIAVTAHYRRTGRCPAIIHSLGGGDSFEIRPTRNGFLDCASGVEVTFRPFALLLGGAPQAIELGLEGDIGFFAYDPGTETRFAGRCGGGASVTLYDLASNDFFQYAVSDD